MRCDDRKIVEAKCAAQRKQIQPGMGKTHDMVEHFLRLSLVLGGVVVHFALGCAALLCLARGGA